MSITHDSARGAVFPQPPRHVRLAGATVVRDAEGFG